MDNISGEFKTEMNTEVLVKDKLFKVCERYLVLSENFGTNKTAFKLATAFVILGGIRSMLLSVDNISAGGNSIGLLYSKERNVGKTLTLQLLAKAQGVVARSHPLLCCGGDQTLSGTSLKVLMHALQNSTLTCMVDDPLMNSSLAEFLLQVQSGLPQGSSKTGIQSPVGSLLMSSNSKECERIYGRILRIEFNKDPLFNAENEMRVEKDLRNLVTENKGFIVAWVMRYISFWVNKDGKKEAMLHLLRNILQRVVPDQQPRWHKAASLLLYTYIMFHQTANMDPDVDLAITHLASTNAIPRAKPQEPFWARLQTQVATKLRKNSEPVLTWLNPQVNVQNASGEWVPAVGILSNVVDSFPGITRQETREELGKVSLLSAHGTSPMPFALDHQATAKDLQQRKKLCTKNLKGFKIPQNQIQEALMNEISYACGLTINKPSEIYVSEEVDPPDDDDFSLTHEEVGGIAQGLSQLFAFLEAMEEGNCYSSEDEEEMTSEHLKDISPESKRTFNRLTPRRKKCFEEGLLAGMRMLERKQYQDEDFEHAAEQEQEAEGDTPAVSMDMEITKKQSGQMQTSINVRKRLFKAAEGRPNPGTVDEDLNPKRLFAEGTIGVMTRNKSKKTDKKRDNNGSEVDDNNSCHKCKLASPPKPKNNDAQKWDWVQCESKCRKWFHLDCVGLERRPQKKRYLYLL